LREHAAAGVANPQNIGSKLDDCVMAGAGDAVEEDGGTGHDSCAFRCVHMPPTLSASAKPPPTGQAAVPAALTRSSAARPETCTVRRREVTSISPKRKPEAHQRHTIAWKIG